MDGWQCFFLVVELSGEVRNEGSEIRASSEDWCLALQKKTTGVVVASLLALEMLVHLCAHAGHDDHVEKCVGAKMDQVVSLNLAGCSCMRMW